MSKVFLNSSLTQSSVPTTSGDAYLQIGVGPRNIETTELDRASCLFIAAGTLSALSVYISTNTVATSFSLSSRINAAAGSQSISASSGATGLFQDLVNTDSISANDKLNYKLTFVGAGSIGFLTASTIFNSSGNATTLIRSDYQGISVASATRYAGLGAGQAWDATENNAREKIGIAGTFKRLSVFITGNARTTTSTARLRKNGANGSEVISITSGTTGLLEDASNTDTVAATDFVVFSLTDGTGTGTITSQFRITFESSSGYGLFCGGANNGEAVSANTTSYFGVAGELASEATVENTYIRTATDFAADISELALTVSANTVSAASTFALRDDGSTTSLSVSITASTTGVFEDTANTASIASGSKLNYILTTGATGTSLTLRNWMCIVLSAFGASGPANLKTYNTNVTANIKTINTNVIANVKTLNTNA